MAKPVPLFSYLRNLFSPRVEERAQVFTSNSLTSPFDVGGIDAGVAVNGDTALGCSTIWAAMRIISESAASLPLKVYEYAADGGRKVASAHPLYTLLHDEPCPGISSMNWREALVACASFRGRAYAEIERRTVDGAPVALWLLSPDSVEPFYAADEKLAYKLTLRSGKKEIIAGADMIHLRGPSTDGINGFDLLDFARQDIGLTIAAEKYGRTFFGNGARPGGVLEHPAVLKDEARKRLREDWSKVHQGPDRAHRLAILEEGMKYASIGVSPEEAQFLQTREFQVSQVARWFNIPASKLRDKSGQSYSSLEAENLAFYTETLRPWLIRLEQELTLKLLSPADRERYYFEHSADAILRADTKTRFEIYALAKNWGLLTTNEIREKENMPRVEGGDVLLQPLNMQPINAPGGPSAPSSTPSVGAVAAPPASTAQQPTDGASAGVVQ